MNLDDQLPGLLAREAEHADAAPPTRDGVQAVIGRRARRRRRQRRVGTGLAALCVVAGAAGGVALSSNDSEPADIVPTGGLPAVPPLGIDAPGLTLRSATEIGAPPDASSEPAVVYFTRATDSPLGPLIVAYLDDEPSFQPPIPTATPVDLDGDGATGGPGDGRVGSLGRGEYVEWTTGDGRPAAVGGYGVERADVIEYVRSLGRQSYSLETVPAPDGFPERVVTGPASAEHLAIYSSERGTTVFVNTTNAPGRFDARRVSLDAVAEVPLGTSILGDGVAVLSDAEPDSVTALVRTEGGLTVEISGNGLDGEAVRDLLADGRFVEVESTEETEASPPSPNVPPPMPTVTPVDPTLAISEPGCESPAGSPTSLADEPEHWLRFGSYDRWRDLDGCPVRIDVISSSVGQSHCDWESAHFVTIGDPLGTSIRAGAQTGRRRYVWNGDGVLAGLPPGRSIPVLDAEGGRLGTDELYVTAEDTGYRWDDRALWLDPEDEDTLYVVDGDEARVYVRDADAGLCA